MSSRNAGLKRLKYKRKRPRKTGLRASAEMRRADFYRLMKKQNGLCARTDCPENNDGVRQKVGSIDDMCFKTPPVIWELLGKKSDPRKLFNRQLLCPTCRKIKTSEDRKRIAALRK